MNRPSIRLLRTALAVGAGVACFFGSENAFVTGSGPLVTQAHAIIGRPLTPVSYAGAARRTTVGVGVGVGVAVVAAPVVVAPVVVAPVVVAPVCAQVVNVYGQITTVCR